MKIFIIALLGVGLSLAQDTRETWVTICTDDSGNQCCANAGMGDAAAPHQYWIIRSTNSWAQQDFACRMERSTAKLAVFESQRENDCVTKYLLDEFEDATSQQYAIGIKVDSRYPGVYEWDRVDNTATDHLDDATLSFKNWVPTAPTGMGCGVMSVGIGDTNNGRWTDVDCNSGSLLYAVCEDYPTTT